MFMQHSARLYAEASDTCIRFRVNRFGDEYILNIASPDNVHHLGEHIFVYYICND